MSTDHKQDNDDPIHLDADNPAVVDVTVTDDWPSDEQPVEKQSEQPPVLTEKDLGDEPAVKAGVETKEKPPVEKTPIAHAENVTQIWPVYEVRRDRDGKILAVPMVGHREDRSNVTNWYSSISPEEMEEGGEELQQIMEATYARSRMHHSSAAAGVKEVNDGKDPGLPPYQNEVDNEELTNGLEYENVELGVSVLRPRRVNAPTRLSGPALRAEIAANGESGGLDTRVTLFGSGFNIWLRPRSETEYYNYEFKTLRASTEAGFKTLGALYQNSQYGMKENFWDFIRGGITAANVANWEAIDLGDIITVTDLISIEIGVSASMHPYGYPLDLYCTAPADKCQHVEKLNLNPARSLWKFPNKLDKSAMFTLAGIKRNLTLDELTKYRQGILGNKQSTFQVGIYEFELEVPTLNQYFDHGRRWVEETRSSLIDIMSDAEVTKESKEDHITRLQSKNVIREYSHWIKKVWVNGKQKYTDTTSGIITILDSLNRDGSPEQIKDFLLNIQAFIERVTMAIAAIPNFRCPICDTEYATEKHEKHPLLVPYDPFRVFFDLARRRLQERGLKLID